MSTECSLCTIITSRYVNMHPTLLFPTFSKISGRPPLSWSTRVQVALDSARGLEYIHEHTVPVYIHRDIKSANILIDKNYRGKVVTVLVFFLYYEYEQIVN